MALSRNTDQRSQRKSCAVYSECHNGVTWEKDRLYYDTCFSADLDYAASRRDHRCRALAPCRRTAAPRAALPATLARRPGSCPGWQRLEVPRLAFSHGSCRAQGGAGKEEVAARLPTPREADTELTWQQVEGLEGKAQQGIPFTAPPCKAKDTHSPFTADLQNA
ncbi:hypothetical protein NDU88_005733 [Pleurodeles waltl]|uniref:Uncharacterized protein n=1 Tax=Pleurodeles waltl TaxID=8319 RepID=A0AAV7QGL1_PLEWA|nr:hypothetical protein NDU88_005733 [Pleurodeles waltl]